MGLSISAVALVVHDYDEAIHFFTNHLRFAVVEDAALSTSKWDLVQHRPAGSAATGG